MHHNHPTVALESTVISHGLPYPHNLALAREMEAIVRANGAEPATVAIIGGELIAGLSPAQIQHLATAPNVRKVSRRDLPIVVARRLDGAEIARIGRTTALDVRLEAIGARPTADLPVSMEIESRDWLTARSVVRDLQGNPAAILAVRLEREIEGQRRRTRVALAGARLSCAGRLSTRGR